MRYLLGSSPKTSYSTMRTYFLIRVLGDMAIKVRCQASHGKDMSDMSIPDAANEGDGIATGILEAGEGTNRSGWRHPLFRLLVSQSKS
mmetsp:Transcript_6008/g.11658  ORF Transcript_6008/g.11658 Transcript_6008/m.11658 type:complete len:88 (+) Transcript_6008:94-357(+)